MSVLTEAQIDSALIPSPRHYKTLLPEGEHVDLPLLLLLHGGGGSSQFLSQMQPVIEQAWAQSLLPPMAIATFDADRSFYLDYKDGGERWESFLLTDWLEHLRRQLPIGRGKEKTLIAGVSMGGHGTCRIALKYPNLFHAMGAMEPAIMPALQYQDIPEANLEFQSAEIINERYGCPPDEYWNANNPAQIVINNQQAIRESGLNIYLEVGTDDFLRLNEGTEFLHQTLLQQDIKHEYRLVLGANHVGNSLAPRFLDMMGFIGRSLAPLAADPFLEQVLKNRSKHGLTNH